MEKVKDSKYLSQKERFLIVDSEMNGKSFFGFREMEDLLKIYESISRDNEDLDRIHTFFNEEDVIYGLETIDRNSCWEIVNDCPDEDIYTEIRINSL